MGLISAALGSAGGVLADQWKEYFYCEALPNNVLAVKGRKRNSGRSSNTKGSDNIISSGSVIAVADGQCMLIVEQGKIVDVCAEPGEYIYDSSTEPSIFSGKLGEGILNVFKQIGKRLPSAARPPRISASTTSTPRSSPETSTALPLPCPSAWWTTISVWISTSPSAASANTAM